MVRNMIVAMSAVLMAVGVASARDEIVSWYCQDDCELMAVVPPGGLVITDVTGAGSERVYFLEDGVLVGRVVVKECTGSSGLCYTASVHFTSGIAFAPGSHAAVELTQGNGATICGYIPDLTQGGTVPAVSTWGLIILGVLVLTLGTVLIGKRKVSIA